MQIFEQIASYETKKKVTFCKQFQCNLNSDLKLLKSYDFIFSLQSGFRAISVRFCKN